MYLSGIQTFDLKKKDLGEKCIKYNIKRDQQITTNKYSGINL